MKTEPGSKPQSYTSILGIWTLDPTPGLGRKTFVVRFWYVDALMQPKIAAAFGAEQPIKDKNMVFYVSDLCPDQ